MLVVEGWTELFGCVGQFAVLKGGDGLGGERVAGGYLGGLQSFACCWRLLPMFPVCDL